MDCQYLSLSLDKELAYGRLSKINILADKPIPAERSEPGGRDGFIAKILES